MKHNKKVILYDEALEFYSKDVVTENKNYKWEYILSMELDNPDTFIIDLFNNNKLDTFPSIYNKKCSNIRKRFEFLVKDEPVQQIPSFLKNFLKFRHPF